MLSYYTNSFTRCKLSGRTVNSDWVGAVKSRQDRFFSLWEICQASTRCPEQLQQLNAWHLSFFFPSFLFPGR